jgi:hypothetical protein
METLVSAKRQDLSFKLLEIMFQKCTKYMPSVFLEEIHCSLFSSLCFIIKFLIALLQFFITLKRSKIFLAFNSYLFRFNMIFSIS